MVFKSVSKTNLSIMFLLFIDNPKFITSGYLVTEIIQTLEKVAQTIIR